MIHPKAVILSGSGKGGTGKSTFAVNLAIELSKRMKTGLLDCDVRAPNVIRLLGLRGQGLMQDPNRMLIPIFYNENLEVFSSASMFEEGLGIAWTGEHVASFLEQSIYGVGWRDIDVLVADLEPSPWDSIGVLNSLFRGRLHAVIVTIPRYVSLDDARRMIDICRDKGIDILGVIANMTGSECPVCGEPVTHCHQEFAPFGSADSVREMATLEKVPFIGQVKFNPVIGRNSDKGHPVFPSSVNGVVNDVIDRLIARLRGDV